MNSDKHIQRLRQDLKELTVKFLRLQKSHRKLTGDFQKLKTKEISKTVYLKKTNPLRDCVSERISRFYINE